MISREEKKRFFTDCVSGRRWLAIDDNKLHPLIEKSKRLIKEYGAQFKGGYSWRAFALNEMCKYFKEDFREVYGLIDSRCIEFFDGFRVVTHHSKEIEDVNRFIANYHPEYAFTDNEIENLIKEWESKKEDVIRHIENTAYNFYAFGEYDATENLLEKKAQQEKERKRLIALELEIKNKNRKQVSRKVRSTLQNMIRAARDGGKNPRSPLLDFTPNDLFERMESLFYDGMSWDNHGEWHVDHIKPVKAFLDEGVKDPAIINALDNLQPLWAQDNRRKSARYETA